MKSVKALKSMAVIFLLHFLAISGAQAEDRGDWKKIDVLPGTYQTTDGNGVAREISPSCSGGPVCTTNAAGIQSCRLGNKDFSFYFKPGKEKKKLVVFFDGGGACWDTNTCVTGQQTPLAAYTPELKAVSTQGLFDQNNPSNPYRDWNLVVLPYCTGDIHWGSKDQSYTDFTGAVTGTPGGSVTIHHRGFDNFLYVREWLMNRFAEKKDSKEREERKDKEEDGDRSNINKLLVTGSSAGAYGAAFAYPHLKQAFPRANGYLLADAGNGVISETLLQQAVRSPDERWGASRNLVRNIPGMDGIFNQPADRFAPAYYSAMAGFYPKDRFSQYSNLFDVIQALFLNISLNQNDIAAWGRLTPQVYGAWTNQMVNFAFITAANPNYRFYIAGGCNHTVLRFNDDFYSTQTTQNPAFLSWFKALTKEGEDGAPPANWVNSFCTGCAIPPTPQEIGACLQRSFSG